MKAKSELKSAYTACQVYFTVDENATNCGFDGMHSQKFYNSSDVQIDITDTASTSWTATSRHDSGNVTYSIDINGKISP